MTEGKRGWWLSGFLCAFTFKVREVKCGVQTWEKICQKKNNLNNTLFICESNCRGNFSIALFQNFFWKYVSVLSTFSFVVVLKIVDFPWGFKAERGYKYGKICHISDEFGGEPSMLWHVVHVRSVPRLFYNQGLHNESVLKLGKWLDGVATVKRRKWGAQQIVWTAASFATL